jgi:hypothetical protein
VRNLAASVTASSVELAVNPVGVTDSLVLNYENSLVSGDQPVLQAFEKFTTTKDERFDSIIQALRNSQSQDDERFNDFAKMMEASIERWGSRIEASMSRKLDIQLELMRKEEGEKREKLHARVPDARPIERVPDTIARESEYFVLANNMKDLRIGLKEQFALFEATFLIVLGGIMGKLNGLSGDSVATTVESAQEDKKAVVVVPDNLPDEVALDIAATLGGIEEPTKATFAISKDYDHTHFSKAIASGKKPSGLWSPAMRRVTPASPSLWVRSVPAATLRKSPCPTLTDSLPPLNAPTGTIQKPKENQATESKKRGRIEDNAVVNVKEPKRIKFLDNGAEIRGDNPLLDAAVVASLLELDPASEVPLWVRAHYGDMEVFTTSKPVFSHKHNRNVPVWLTSATARLLR